MDLTQEITDMRPFGRKQFRDFCRELATRVPRQGRDYLDYHASRFYSTYREAANLLRPGDTFLSVGAGTAYVEAALTASTGAQGVVVDFPETIRECQEYYRHCGLEAVALDLAEATSLERVGQNFQLVLSCEIVEHIPAPPRKHFGLLAPLLKKGGYLLVTTPNAGSLVHIAKTLLHIPILPDPERCFGAVCYENEGVHRREYMRSEIESALARCGLTPTRTSFIWYNTTESLAVRAAYPLQFVIPRFRPAMNVVGRREN